MTLRMVIIACSQTKLDHAAPASRIYTGAAWSTWRRHAPPSPPCGWSVWALSAEYGLVPSWRTLEPYNRKLTAARVEELAPLIADTWRAQLELETVRHRQDQLLDVEAVVVGGELYQRLARRAGLPVVATIDGATAADCSRGGIGVLRQRLGSWARLVTSSGNATPEAADAWAHLVELDRRYGWSKAHQLRQRLATPAPTAPDQLGAYHRAQLQAAAAGLTIPAELVTATTSNLEVVRASRRQVSRW